jgi:alpha-tubulin suppressor-like RCC1 family protein
MKRPTLTIAFLFICTFGIALPGCGNPGGGDQNAPDDANGGPNGRDAGHDSNTGDAGPSHDIRSDYVRVEAAGSFVCGHTESGKLHCTGYLPPTPGDQIIQDFALGTDGNFWCFISDDKTLSCNGLTSTDDYGQVDPPSGEFSTVTAGTSHACALSTEGNVSCWGLGSSTDDEGDLNDEDQALPPQKTFRTISAHGHVTCGVDSTGKGHCWGNGYEQKGEAIFPDKSLTQLMPGSDGPCAILEDKHVLCANGPSGPAGPTGTYTGLDQGSEGTCAVAQNGTLACWGSRGSRGLSTLSRTFKQVSLTFSYYKCALDNEGRVGCWDGSQEGMQSLGFAHIETGSMDSDNSFRTEPQFVDSYDWIDEGCALADRDDLAMNVECTERLERKLPPGKFTDVAFGKEFACGIHPNGDLTCRFDFFDVSDSTANRLKQVPDGTFQAVMADGTAACALSESGDVSCWGNPDVTPPSGSFQKLTLSKRTVCGLTTSGEIRCDGPDYGPVNPPAGSFTDLTAEHPEFGCGVKDDGTLECWPADSGDITRNVPSGSFLEVTSGTIRSRDQSYPFACAVGTDHTATCWGAFAREEFDAPSGKFSAIHGRCGLRKDSGEFVCW